jgi:two-component system sensor histidine kinase/response regulator
VTHALGARRDVTDEVHAAELLRIQKDELQAAQRRLERASLSVQEGHWEIDLATGKHWASSNYYVLLGYSPDETSLNTLERVRELIHPDDLERAHRSAWDHLLENKPHDVELRVRTKDGDYRWFRLRSSSERDENGVALRMSGSITEIERQKAAEDALREAQARFERAIHGTKDGLWEVDMVARKMWLSPRLHELLGYEVGELGDHHDVLRALVHPDDLAVADAAVARQFESDEPLECEVRMRRKSGDYRWFSFRGSASSNERPVTRVSGSMQDVTRERLAQDALIRASEEARSANQAKSVFLANMSHEIRTPMNGIIGMATLLLDTRLDAVQREYAETIQTSSQSLLTIINDILDFSKIEAGKLDIEAIDFDVRTVVEEVMSTLEFQASSKGLQLTVNVAPGVPAHVIGDPQRIRQCLINLVGNAVKFTREGGVAVAVSLSGTSDDEQPLVRFEVRDTGIGIDPQSVKSLFQPFVQADSSTTRYFGGTGLGLSIVRGLVEMMGGEVGASSEPGKGSTFWFTLPLKAATASARRPAPQGAAAGWDTRRFRGKVLLVEDNGVNQRVAQRFLERLGCTVVLAQNGAEGVKAWEQEEFALVLMDIQMPVMDGYTATRNIRLRESDGRRTPIVALTANAMKGQLDRCHEAGMDGLLTKPIVLERLREVLERFGLGVECHEALPEQAVEALVTTGAEPPAVDCSELAELAGEDFEFVQSVVLSFEKSMAQLLSTMRAAAGRGEMQQVARAAHQVKGAAANLHAKALSALAADIEASARSLCATDLEERLKSLAREIDRATIALHAFAERARQRASA